MLPDHPKVPLRIEAAAYRGRPVYFQLIYPWTKPVRQEETGFTQKTWVAVILIAAVMTAILIGALLLARRNLRMGRGDRKGAFKLSFFVFSITFFGMVFGAGHVPSPARELAILYESVRNALFLSGLIWLVYVALEPSARRYWPSLMISWSRLLAGEYRDPMVGRDVLIGGLLGLCHTLGLYIGSLLPHWLGRVQEPIRVLNFESLLGLPKVMAFLCSILVVSIFLALVYLFFLLLLYTLLRKERLAMVATWLLATSILGLLFTDSWLELPGLLIVTTSFVFAVARLGLLAAVSWNLFFNVSFHSPLTTDFSIWYSGSMVFGVLVITGLAIYGFHTALAGQPVFQNRLLED